MCTQLDSRDYVSLFLLLVLAGIAAYIESVRAVEDPNPLPPGIFHKSVIVSTPQREMKFTAASEERHEIWLSVS